MSFMKRPELSEGIFLTLLISWEFDKEVTLSKPTGKLEESDRDEQRSIASRPHGFLDRSAC
jgi:hypothetical protein